MILQKKDWGDWREKIESLFYASYGRPLPPGYLDWRYLENISDNLLFSVEVEGADVVASYSAFPVDVRYDDCCVRTMVSMTTMTHPQWQGRGLFPKLARELYEHARTLDIACVWGFPNANSHPAFNKKLGWTDIYEIPTFKLLLENIDLSALPDTESVVDFDDRFLLQYPVDPGDGLVRVGRSGEYLRWRYGQHPFNNYKNFVLSSGGFVSSYVVAKIYENGFDLVDVECSGAEEGMLLLAHVVKHAAALGLAELNCWCPTHHPMHAVYERLRFSNSAPVTYFGGRSLTAGVDSREWLDYRKWYVQMGDSDVY